MPNAALTTFAVSPVTPATEPLPEVPYAEAIQTTLSNGMSVETLRQIDRLPHVTLESCSRRTGSLLGHTSCHPFVSAVGDAFAQHRPLTLSPDMIWLLVAQGFALHVQANAEELRGQFVTHQGKKTLTVRRDEFVRGFAGNDWEGVFTEFSNQIQSHIGDEMHDFLVPQFSTTGLVEKAANEIALMDVLAPYFDYILRTMCGIPSITLEGTVLDWVSLRQRAGHLAGFGCDWWVIHLLPVLDQFVRASRGDVDTDFWQSFFKAASASGGPYIHGHIRALLPYVYQRGAYQREGTPQRNVYLGVESDWYRDGLTTSDLPSGLSQVPLEWQYYQQVIPMKLLSGFVGVAQDPATLALRPEIGWAVCEA